MARLCCRIHSEAKAVHGSHRDLPGGLYRAHSGLNVSSQLLREHKCTGRARARHTVGFIVRAVDLEALDRTGGHSMPAGHSVRQLVSMCLWLHLVAAACSL